MAHDLASLAAFVPARKVATQIAELADAGLAPATQRAYQSDWARFSAWCASRDANALPCSPEVLAAYLAEHADVRAPATLDRWLATIAKAHDTAGVASPTRHPLVVAVRNGIRRTRATAQRKARPLSTPMVRAMAEGLPATVRGDRDRALLLLGFAAALRRSELTALDVADAEIVADGCVLTIRRSKTDQEGAGVRLGVAYGQHAETCPVRALTTWLESSGHGDGALLRSVDRHGNVGDRLSDRSVSLILKHLAEAAGLPAEEISGHSLRAGHATEAARAGVAEADIARQTRHQSVATLRGYVREGQLFARNSSAALGL